MLLYEFVRTTEKCDSLVDKGAKTESTPSDVASQSDIIFICVSDGKTAKELIFGNCGAIVRNMEYY